MKVQTHLSMGDVLPPKRQTVVVERLKRRFENYRRHQNSCLPRYEQAANGLYETQRQDTLLLKQRYLESKAKKAKSKSDHRTYKEATTDASKSQMHSKPLKRSAEDAIPNVTTETTNNEDTEKPAKIQCTESVSDKPAVSDLPPPPPNQHPTLPTFSVQIVQQFTQSPHNQSPQTIQTNVTVQTLSNKPLQSPIPQNAQSNQIAQEPPVSSQEDTLQTAVRNIVPIQNNVECKQEKDNDDSDLCQFKNNQASNNSVSSGGDRLSDTFPSIEFTDESGEHVLHPDILNDLIEDVFINSADIMKDFNFEDSVGSIKDSEDAAKDIIELVKGPSPSQLRSFQSDNLSFANTPPVTNQQNGLFRNIPASNETPVSTIPSNTSAPVTSSSTAFYNTAPQRLPSYGNSPLPLPNGLGLDFKMTEPSPAALTLKQLAEQHQNMQQKQQQQSVNSPLTNRPQPFNQNTFTSHMNPLRSANYMNGSNPVIQSNSPKMLNSGTSIFNAFDQRLNNFPGTESSTNFQVNCDSMSLNNVLGNDTRYKSFDVITDPVRALQMKIASHQQKPPAYGTTRPLTHYADNSSGRHPIPVNSQQQNRPVGRQFQNNAAGVRLQMSQVQQIQPRQHNAQQLPQDKLDIKQQQHTIMQPHSNMYGNYSPQQSVGNPSFNVSMSQSLAYSSQFTTNSGMNRPPPEYKAAHHRNSVSDNLIDQLNAASQVMFNELTKSKYPKQQRPPNVTITPDGSISSSSHDWRNNIINSQQQNQFRVGPFTPQQNYSDLNSNVPVSPNIPLSPIYNQFRMPSNQIPSNRPMARPNMVPTNHMVQQRQRLGIPQRVRNPQIIGMEQHSSMAINSNAMNPNNMMGPMYSEHQEMERQDGSHLNLDFLDNIESSASDLLNFDQVMQSGPHFPILDDILGK